jgi:hypothetical protein
VRPPAPAEAPLAVASPASFRAGFRPLLERATAAANDLVAMGDARERNLLHIRDGQEAMEAALAEADAWLATHLPSPADEPMVAVYRHGAAAIRTATAEAQAGFLRFDFERVARATETMRSGAADLARATALLD